MTTPASALGAIKKFLKKLEIDVDRPDFVSDDARRTYRRFHAMLLWELALDREEIAPEIRLYNREMLADLATAYMMNFMGAYKASRLCLRGAIENGFRVFTAAAGQDILQISTVYGLVDSCKINWGTSPEKFQTVSNLYALYGELCKTVHSVAIDYMSLRVPFERILSYNHNEFSGTLSSIDSISHLFGEGYYLEFHRQLTQIHYKSADYIRDSVGADIKKLALGGSE